MRFEIRTLGENWSVKIATIHLNGEFGFNEGSAFWNACEPEKQQCQVYYFDLSEVTALRRDGLTWLRVFLCWARECGRSVRFINTSQVLQDHLAAAGISMEGTATERTARTPSDKPSLGGNVLRREDLAEALRTARPGGILRFG